MAERLTEASTKGLRPQRIPRASTLRGNVRASKSLTAMAPAGRLLIFGSWPRSSVIGIIIPAPFPLFRRALFLHASSPAAAAQLSLKVPIS
jgi:hypothetical protein